MGKGRREGGREAKREKRKEKQVLKFLKKVGMWLLLLVLASQQCWSLDLSEPVESAVRESRLLT